MFDEVDDESIYIYKGLFYHSCYFKSLTASSIFGKLEKIKHSMSNCSTVH